MFGFILQLSGLAAAAGLAIYLARGKPLLSTGITLLCTCVVTAVFVLTRPPADIRLMFECAMVMPVVLAALWAWVHDPAAVAPRAIIALSLSSCCLIFGVGLVGMPGHRELNLFEFMLNIIYLAQCACVGAGGVGDIVVGWFARIERNHNLDRPHYDQAWILRQLEEE